MAKKHRIEVRDAYCKRCGVCVGLCPNEALAQDSLGKPWLRYPEKCSGCALCELRCPDYAIEVLEA